MRSLVWVWNNWMTALIDGGSHFRMRIILGTILYWFLVLHVCVPACSRNGSGVWPYLLVQENSSNLARAPKMGKSGLLNSWDSFLVTPLSFFSETCSYVPRYFYERTCFVTGCSYDVPLVFLLQRLPTFVCFSILASFEEKNATQLWRLKYFLFVNLETITKNAILQIEQPVHISTVN